MKEEVVVDQHLVIVINWWLFFKTKELAVSTLSVVNAVCLPCYSAMSSVISLIDSDPDKAKYNQMEKVAGKRESCS